MGVQERRERERLQRRENILEAAERIFAQRGFEEASMADIAEEAELSKGTLYLYFTSKDDLAFAIFYKSLDQSLGRVIEEAAESPGTGMDRLHGIARAFLSCYRNRQENFIFHNNLGYFFREDREDSPNARLCMARIDRILDTVARAMEDGIRDGSVREVDYRKRAVVLANLMLNLMMQFSARSSLLIRGHDHTPEEIMEYTLEIFLNSMERR